jgi:THO complex subunit 4
MSGKLDQSLDEITTAQRRSTRARRPVQRRSTSGRPTSSAPIGGIQKSTKAPRGAANKPALAKAAAAHGDSKVIVSNLPKDVTEKQIKVCFG